MMGWCPSFRVGVAVRPKTYLASDMRAASYLCGLPTTCGKKADSHPQDLNLYGTRFLSSAGHGLRMRRSVPVAGGAMCSEVGRRERKSANSSLRLRLSCFANMEPYNHCQSRLEPCINRSFSVVTQGRRIAAVVRPGQLRIVASFSPADALGSIHPGQPGRLRLTGFPWTQYGSISASVTRAANEVRDAHIRVELIVSPVSRTQIPVQHGLLEPRSERRSSANTRR